MSNFSSISVKSHYQTQKWRLMLLVFLSLISFASCKKNAIETIKNIANDEVLPSLMAENFEMLYSDSTVIRFKLQTPKLIRHESDRNPYNEFPEGVKIEQYDMNMMITSSISALYAKNFDSDDRWEAKNNVVAVNQKGDTLKTEYLVWDVKKQKIYSNQFVKIIQKDQIYTGTGFESNQDFSVYSFKNLKGHIYVDVDDK
jgi:LPS export ABC transporter protein LptC